MDVLSWTTDAGRRFKVRMCGRVSGGEVEALLRGLEVPSGRLGAGVRARWSGGVVEVPLGTTE